jgi:hypothetical protein
MLLETNSIFAATVSAVFLAACSRYPAKPPSSPSPQLRVGSARTSVAAPTAPSPEPTVRPDASVGSNAATASASGDSADLLTGVPDPRPSPTEESSTGKQTSASGCLRYEPETAVLRGVIERATFPGPPNYQSIAKGDAKETHWLLRLEHPRCVEAAEDSSDAAHSRIRRVQLVFDVDDQPHEQYRNLVGRKVEASGTLFGAHTGHHHTDILRGLGVNCRWLPISSDSQDRDRPSTIDGAGLATGKASRIFYSGNADLEHRGSCTETTRARSPRPGTSGAT